MNANLIYGNNIAQPLLTEIAQLVIQYKEHHNGLPGLAIVLVGNNPASEAYVKIKLKRARTIGLHTEVFRFSETLTEEELLTVIDELNARDDIHGIIIQLPLPPHFNSFHLINRIDPQKDVDGLTLHNIGKLHTNQHDIAPCTPKGILHLLKTLPIQLEGKHVAIIGRSQIVGKPLGALLLHENCTITHIHSYSQNWEQLTQLADIVVVATGQPNLLTDQHIKEGAIIIDVGSTKRTNENGLSYFVGDVDRSVLFKASYVTPVPGGVGPMTVAMLMQNTVEAAWRQSNARR